MHVWMPIAWEWITTYKLRELKESLTFDACLDTKGRDQRHAVDGDKRAA